MAQTSWSRPWTLGGRKSSTWQRTQFNLKLGTSGVVNAVGLSRRLAKGFANRHDEAVSRKFRTTGLRKHTRQMVQFNLDSRDPQQDRERPLIHNHEHPIY
jgi:hypothetical protein